MPGLPYHMGRPNHMGPQKEKSSYEVGWHTHVFLQRPQNCKGSHLPPHRSTSWEGLPYFQHPGPFLGSLTGVWFMFPNSPPFPLTPHSNEHCTLSKEHSGCMGNSIRLAPGWELQSDLPTTDLSFSTDRRELASIWGECSFNKTLWTHKTHFHLYVLPSFRMLVVWNRKNENICYHAKSQAIGLKSPWGHRVKSFHWLPSMCPHHST